MRHDDPWIFGMLWEIEQHEEQARLARARQVRHAAAWRAAPSPRPSAPRFWTVLSQLTGSLTSITWLRLRRWAAHALRYSSP
jgi:hypothetical protein